MTDMSGLVLVCRECQIAAEVTAADPPDEVRCRTCYTSILGAESVRKMLHDEARRIGFIEARNMIERAFRDAPGIELQPGDPPPRPAWPFIYRAEAP